MGRLQERGCNFKRQVLCAKVPTSTSREITWLSPSFTLDKAPVLCRTDVDKMGLFLMGPTLSPCYQPGGGGAAAPARDAAGPADTEGRLWSQTQDTPLTGSDSTHWEWLPKCPQTPWTRAEPLKHGQTSQNLLKFTAKREVDEIKERKMSCGYEKCWLGLSQWGK